MRLVSFILSFLISFSAIADCTVMNGSTPVKIAEKAEVSLYDKGKSLENFHVQDQDGLGVCYANATSTLLKTVLPNNPDISYTHAALVSSTDGWRSSSSWSNNEGKAKYIGETNDFTYGGYICETIAALKKRGGACVQNKSLIEKTELMNPQIQERILQNLGKYFDKVNSIKANPAKYGAFKKDLALIVEKLSVENDNFIKKCEESKKTLPIEVPLESMGVEVAFDLIQDKGSACSAKKIEALKTLLNANANLNIDRIEVKFKKEIIEKLRSRLVEDKSLEAEIMSFMDRKKDDPEKTKSLGLKMDKVLNDFFNDNLKSDDPNCSFSKDGKSFFVENRLDPGASFIYGVKFDYERDCNAEMKTMKGFEYDSLINKNQCSDVSSIKLITDAIEPLLDIGYKLDGALEKSLENPQSLQANQLSNILHPECNDKNNLIPLNNIACASFSMCDESGGNDYSNYDYSGPKAGCLPFDTAKSMMRIKTFNAMKDNRALAVSVCTSFLLDPSKKTNFCKTKPEGVEGHAMHSMTVSGYRCVNNKIEYQLTNSWGSGYCPIQDGTMKNSAFECIQDKYKNATGKFWVTEDVLVDSTKDVNAVVEMKK